MNKTNSVMSIWKCFEIYLYETCNVCFALAIDPAVIKLWNDMRGEYINSYSQLKKFSRYQTDIIGFYITRANDKSFLSWQNMSACEELDLIAPTF